MNNKRIIIIIKGEKRDIGDKQELLVKILLYLKILSNN